MIGHVWSNGRHSQLRLEVADLEEFIARCGWTVAEDIEGLTDEARREINRLEALPEIECNGGRPWWEQRLIASEPTQTADM